MDLLSKSGRLASSVAGVLRVLQDMFWSADGGENRHYNLMV